MTWDALSAIGSIGAALVLFVASVAAVIQLKHVRLANQMGSYLELMHQLNAPEMVAAREWVEAQDFDDPETLRKAFDGGLDQRIIMLAGYYQTVARLINFGILDRDLFAGFTMSAPLVWKSLRPIAYETRKRKPGNPRWMDLEYLVYNQRTMPSWAKRYSAEFRARVGMDRQLQDWLQTTGEGAMREEPAAE